MIPLKLLMNSLLELLMLNHLLLTQVLVESKCSKKHGVLFVTVNSMKNPLRSLVNKWVTMMVNLLEMLMKMGFVLTLTETIIVLLMRFLFYIKILNVLEMNKNSMNVVDPVILNHVHMSKMRLLHVKVQEMLLVCLKKKDLVYFPNLLQLENSLLLLSLNSNVQPKVVKLFSEEIPVQSILLNVLQDVFLNQEMFGVLPFIFKNHQFVKLQSMLVFYKKQVVLLKWSKKKDKINMKHLKIEELPQLLMIPGDGLSLFLNLFLYILNYP
jgi:hypothetical protein